MSLQYLGLIVLDSTILVLDDDPDVVALLGRALGRDGYRVLTCTDPRDALDVYAREQPCLIITDLMLPHMDGEDFLARLRRRFEARVPVIILSASAIREEVAARAGADATIGKPFGVEDLRATVRRLCDEGRARTHH